MENISCSYYTENGLNEKRRRRTVRPANNEPAVGENFFSNSSASKSEASQAYMNQPKNLTITDFLYKLNIRYTLCLCHLLQTKSTRKKESTSKPCWIRKIHNFTLHQKDIIFG